MDSVTNEDCRRRLIAALDARSFNWPLAVRSCEQIVVFGSWAVAAETQNSDIDVFCVGHGERYKTSRIDIIYAKPAAVLQQTWLGSELANHIAKYGVWVHGGDNWSSSTFISSDAIGFKRRLIRARARALQRLWRSLGREYRVKHVIKIRRDVQRLSLMTSRRAVMPTPFLDKWWRHLGNSAEAFCDIVEGLNERPLVTPTQVKLFADYLPRLKWQLSDARAVRQLDAIPRCDKTAVGLTELLIASPPKDSSVRP